MYKKASFIENRIKWAASKHGLPTANSFFFEDLESNVRNKYLDRLKDYEIGNSVLLFKDENENWTIVGTDKVAWGSETELKIIPHNEIHRMQPKQLKDVKEKVKFVRDVSKKSDWHELSVTDNLNNETILTAQKGGDFFALWNILLMLGRLSK